MASLSEDQLLFTLLAVALILVIGRGAAEVARRLGQPEVLGELLGGVLLGPSCLGALFAGPYHAIFLDQVVSQGLSLLSWIGAIVLLLIAGLEVDIHILRQNARSGTFAAAGAIAPSLVAGALFASIVLGIHSPNNLFLGLVLSVTAVSVVAKILIEREALRRSYAQVILAAGVASEVLVWLLIAIVAALHSGNALTTGLRAAALAIIFFAAMLTLGRRFTFWAMRRVADWTSIVNGELSLVLVLTFLAAALTEWLGLHALLGAFVFGVLLSQSPRATETLKTRIQTLTVSLFAPIFFVTAGMRVNIFQLGGVASLGIIVMLFLVATVVKVGFGVVSARLGGLRPLEALLVGVGLNLKGGTDVIVAILGAQLGLLTVRIYTLYAVVAILTVLVTPPVIAALEKRVPPSRDELERLNREEAQRRAYLPHLERVLVPVAPELHSDIAALVVQRIAQTKAAELEIFDITQLALHTDNDSAPQPAGVTSATEDHLTTAGQAEQVEVTRLQHQSQDVAADVLTAAKDHDLLAFGATPVAPNAPFSLGATQDALLRQANEDILIVVADSAASLESVKRILVPINAFAHSLAATDIAAYLAKAYGAEITLFTSVRAHLDSLFWKERSHKRLLAAGYQLTKEGAFRAGRLGLRIHEQVVVNDDPGAAIRAELDQGQYDLVVMGAVDRSTDDRIYLGSPIEEVLGRGHTPAALLVTKG